jgi:hypothetical protein
VKKRNGDDGKQPGCGTDYLPLRDLKNTNKVVLCDLENANQGTENEIEDGKNCKFVVDKRKPHFRRATNLGLINSEEQQE